MTFIGPLEKPLWIVSTAIPDRRHNDGRRVMTVGEDRQPLYPSREDTGSCAIVEALTPEEAAERGVNWLADEYGTDGILCDSCEGIFLPPGVVVLPYVNALRMDYVTIWSRMELEDET